MLPIEDLGEKERREENLGGEERGEEGKRGFVLALTGKYGVGKDTMADYLVAKYGFVKVSLADALKVMTSRRTGLPLEVLRAETPELRIKREMVGDDVFGFTGREWLELLGERARRKDENYWIKQLPDLVELLKGKNVVIPDARYINEYIYFKQYGYICSIERDSVTETISEKLFDISKKEYFDFTLKNTTQTAFYHQIDLLMVQILKNRF